NHGACRKTFRLTGEFCRPTVFAGLSIPIRCWPIEPGGSSNDNRDIDRLPVYLHNVRKSRMLKNKAALVHALVWVVLLTVLYLVNMRERPADASVLIFIYGIVNIVIFYIHYFLINPLLIGENRYWRAIIYMVIVLTISI